MALKKDEILSAEAKSKIFSPHGKMEDNKFYDYGWSLQKTPRGTNLIEHNGGDEIFFADFIWRDPKRHTKKKSFDCRSNRARSGQSTDDTQQSETAAFEKLNVKIKGILDEAIKGDFTKLQSAIVPERFEVFKSFLLEVLKASEGNNPSTAKYEIIASHPLWFSKGQPLTTFVRLTDDKGLAWLLLIKWENDRIRGLGVTRESDDVTLRTPLVANSKKAFAGFHVGLEKPLDISFNTNQKSGAVAIEFQTNQGIKTAKKVGVP